MRMWFASLIARPVAKERKKKSRKKRLLGHVFSVALLTFINSFEKRHSSKHFARPVSARITHRVASPPKAGIQNTSHKH